MDSDVIDTFHGTDLGRAQKQTSFKTLRLLRRREETLMSCLPDFKNDCIYPLVFPRHFVKKPFHAF